VLTAYHPGVTEAPRTVREGAGAFPTSAARRSPTVALIAEIVNVHLDPGYAEASRRRSEEPPTIKVRRVRSALTAIICLVLGAVLAIGYRQTVSAAPLAAQTRQTLLSDVDRRTAVADDLQRQADQLRQEVAQRRAAENAGSSTGAVAEQRALDLETSTGFAKVHGPGIEVVVGDGPAPIDPVTGQPKDTDYPGRIQDGDLQRLVNALWQSGAEAIAISGQRITPVTAIRSAGEAVQVDLRPVVSPYTVQAIGNADQISERLTDSPAGREFADLGTQYGVKFTVAAKDDVELPAATLPTLREASPPPASSPAPPSGRPSASPSGRPSAARSPSGGASASPSVRSPGQSQQPSNRGGTQ
jgi:uncharacterized protein YlxW (UPF0749 family)